LAPRPGAPVFYPYSTGLKEVDREAMNAKKPKLE
jgi:hypothetical protein